MYFLAHAIPQRPVDRLVLLDPGLAAEFRAYDHRLEMLAVADHLDVIAREAVLDVRPDLFGGDHFNGVLSDEACNRT